MSGIGPGRRHQQPGKGLQNFGQVRPGRYVILGAAKLGGRTPLTMADIAPDKGSINICMLIGKSIALFKTL
jgi:NAD(P)H-flavin reductase